MTKTKKNAEERNGVAKKDEKPVKFGRIRRTSRDVRGGCFKCHGSNAVWWGPNAHGVAVRHHDATGHETWVDVAMSICYGDGGADDKKKPPVKLPASQGGKIVGRNKKARVKHEA